jgi:hypothetical protein
MNLKMMGCLEFEAESASDMGDLLFAKSDAWHKRQCVDKSWWKYICKKNLRGNLSKVKLRFVRKGNLYSGRAVFSVLVS